MDLLILVLVLVLVGFLIWLLTENVPMPPYWKVAIQIIALIVVILFLLRRIGVPNIL